MRIGRLAFLLSTVMFLSSSLSAGDGWKTIRNDDLEFSISVLSDWSHTLVDSSYLLFESPEKDAFLFMQPFILDYDDEIDAVSWISEFLEDEQLCFPFFPDEENDELEAFLPSVTGKTYEQAVFTHRYNDHGRRMRLEIHTYLDPDYALLYGMAAPDENFIFRMIAQETMVSSFKLNGWEDPRDRRTEISSRPVYEEPPANASQVSLTRHIIHDPQFDVEVARCLLPEDWSFSAEMVWDWQKVPPVAFPLVSIANREETMQMHYLPRHYYFISTNPLLNQSLSANHGYLIMDIMEPVDLLEQVILPNYLTYIDRYSVVKDENLPQLADKLKQEFYGNSSNSFVFAHEFRLRFLHRGTWFYNDVFMILEGFFEKQMMMVSKTWNLNTVVIQIPEEMEDALKPKVQMMLNSFKWNKGWRTAYQRFATWYNQQAAIAARANSQVSVSSAQNRLYQTLSETSDIVNNGYWERSNTYNNIYQNMHEYNFSVDTWADPYQSDLLEFDNIYNSVWTNGSGEYKVSTDPSFDPSKSSNGNWYKLRNPD